MRFKLTESQLQILLFDWCHMNRQRYPELQLMFHIPNGGYRNIATAKRLKAEGVKAGVPDICLPVARGNYHGLYLELKTDKGRLSKDQENWLFDLNKQGYLAEVAYGFDEAVKVIKGYLELN